MSTSSPAPEGVAAPPLLVAELRDIQHEERLLATQRELMDSKTENLRLRKDRVLREVARTTGLTGGLRLDLTTGLVFPQQMEVPGG